jgi:hypothetical protein
MVTSGRIWFWLIAWVTAWVLFALMHPAHAATTQLPPGEVCFQTATGPVSSGSINMYFPGTTTPKTTWQDSGQVTPNTQPIQLDANGCAIIYGVGVYRQQLYSGPVVLGATSGNLIFDLNTTDTSAYNATFWAGQGAGSPNIITVVDAGFNATDGTVINFTANATNTGPTTLNPSGFGAINIVKDTTAGSVSLVGGEIVTNNVVSVLYRAFDNQFHILNPVVQSAAGSSAPLCGAMGYTVVNTGGNVNTQLTVTATTAVLVSATGGAINRASVNVNLNTANVGANGLDTGSLATSSMYYIYLIDNGSAPASLASLSSSAPALPAGYTFACRLSADYTDGSSHLGQIQTFGKRTIITGTSPFTNTTSTGTCVTAFTAVTFNLPLTAGTAFGSLATVGATNSGIGTGTAGATIVRNIGVASLTNTGYFETPLAPATTIYYCSSSTNNTVTINGWVDNTNAN